MTIECINTLHKKRRSLYDNYWKRIFIVMWNSWPTELDDKASEIFVNKIKYLWHKRMAQKLRTKLQSEWFKIILDPTQYWSKYNALEKRITIGVKNHSDATSYFKSANFNENVDEWYLIWAMFIHECSHHIVNKCINSQEISQLRGIISRHILDSNTTLTKLSQSYNWWNKIKEDITELIRMYISSPKVLKKHLHFLRKTWDPAVLSQYDLCRISKKEEKTIFSLIEKLVEEYLE